MNNVNKNFYSYFYLNVSIIMLDSEFMNLQDDFRPNNNFSCWPNDSFIELCLVQSLFNCGKAPAFGAGIRRFESYRPSHFFTLLLKK